MKPILLVLVSVVAASVAFLWWSSSSNEHLSPAPSSAAKQTVASNELAGTSDASTDSSGPASGVASRAFTQADARSGLDVFVIDADGRPIADAYVYMAVAGDPPMRPSVPRTNVHGRAGVVRKADASVHAWHPAVGYGVVPAPADDESVTIVLERGRSIRLVARLPDGSPLEGVRVRLSHRAFLWSSPETFDHALPVGPTASAQFSTVTEESGVASLAGLRAGRYFVRLDHRSHVPTEPGACFELDLVSDVERSVSFVPVEAVVVMLRGIDPADVRWSQPRSGIVSDRFLGLGSAGMLRIGATLRARTGATFAVCAVRKPDSDVAPVLDLTVEPPGFESRRFGVAFRPLSVAEPTVIDVRDFVAARNAADVSVDVLSFDGSILADRILVSLEAVGRKFTRSVASGTTVRLIAGSYEMTVDDAPASLIGTEQVVLRPGETKRVALKARVPLARVEFDATALGENPDGVSLNVDPIGSPGNLRRSIIFFGAKRSYWFPAATQWRGDGRAGGEALLPFRFETRSPGETSSVSLRTGP
jgi:hypothetical protein